MPRFVGVSVFNRKKLVQLEHPITALHEAIASACYVDFNDIEYETYDYESRQGNMSIRDLPRVTKSRRPTTRDVEVVAMFAQSWASTALGFGGVGGNAISPAYTVVIKCHGEYCVYFGGRLAYKITSPNQEFFESIQNRDMLPVSQAGRYASV